MEDEGLYYNVAEVTAGWSAAALANLMNEAAILTVRVATCHIALLLCYLWYFGLIVSEEDEGLNHMLCVQDSKLECSSPYEQGSRCQNKISLPMVNDVVEAQQCSTDPNLNMIPARTRY
jgi:hypothetical protein